MHIYRDVHSPYAYEAFPLLSSDFLASKIRLITCSAEQLVTAKKTTILYSW